MLLVTIVLGAASYRFFEIPLRNLIAGRRHDKPIQEIAGSHSPARTKA
jgi:peptidoglycan/LPS O-acetylase OafA/YrhL